MTAWILVPALVSLRNEFNQLAPDRDKTSDGSIGDAAHAVEGNSDHLPDEDFPALRDKDADTVNEIHAIDVDSDLRKTGWTMDRAVQVVVTRHRDRVDDRLQNVIWNGRIWSRSWGWTARAYTGPSKHTEHGHFSARYTTAQEADTRPWGLLEEDDMNDVQLLAFLATPDVQALLAKAAGVGVHGQKLGKSEITIGQAVQTTYSNVSLLAKTDNVDEAEIARQVLTGMDYRAIADAVVAVLPDDQAQQLLDALAARLVTRTAG